MDIYTKKEFESYSRCAAKYKVDHPNRYKWYKYTYEDLMNHWTQMVELIPPMATSIIEVGCGIGTLGDMIVKARPDIKYQGFDIVEKNIEEGKRKYPHLKLYQGNYWQVLTQKKQDWDFLISCSTLFTTTDLKYAPLLFDVLHNSCEKGFSLYALGGTWGIPADLRDNKMWGMISRSKTMRYVYYKGPRDFLERELLRRNIPIILWRDGIIKAIPVNIPKILIEDGTLI